MRYRVDHTIQSEGNPPVTINLYRDANALHSISAIAGALEEDNYYEKYPLLAMPRTLSITITALDD